jgi:hypothetical protein
VVDQACRNRRSTSECLTFVLAGEKFGGDFLVSQHPMVADQVESMKSCAQLAGWLIDEAAEQVIPRLVKFFQQ